MRTSIIGLVLLGFMLACGGVSVTVAKDNLVDCGVQLKGVSAGPEKAQVQAMIERGWLGADTMGFGATSTFEAACKTAAADGVLTAEEVEQLTRASDAFPGVVSKPEHAQALADLSKRVAKVRLTARYQDWELGQLKGWMQGRGMAPNNCEQKRGDWGESSECQGVFDNEDIEIEWNRFDASSDAKDYEDDLDGWWDSRRKGKILLLVKSTDLVAARELTDAFVDRKLEQPLAREEVQALLKKTSVSVEDCRETKDDDDTVVICTINWKRANGKIYLTWSNNREAWVDEPALRANEGYLSLDHGSVKVEVMLWGPDAAKRAMTHLLDLDKGD